MNAQQPHDLPADVIRLASGLRNDNVRFPQNMTSLWHMIQIDGPSVLKAFSFLGASIKHLEQARTERLSTDDGNSIISARDMEDMLACGLAIKEFALQTDMKSVQLAADEFIQCLHDGGIRERELTTDQLGNLTMLATIMVRSAAHGIGSHRLLAVNWEQSKFYADNAHHFGLEVDDAFPEAWFDIQEAGKCRALDRWTACVMHTMRVLELGLRGLAKHVGVDHQANWNTTLGQIEASLRTVTRKEHGEQAEQWAAEAGTHLRFIKNAWRNHAIHALATYDKDRAVEIFDGTASFMQHLARQMAQDTATDTQN